MYVIWLALANTQKDHDIHLFTYNLNSIYPINHIDHGICESITWHIKMSQIAHYVKTMIAILGGTYPPYATTNSLNALELQDMMLILTNL